MFKINQFIRIVCTLLLISCTNQKTQSSTSPVEEAVVPPFTEDISDYLSVTDIKPIDDSLLFSSIAKMVSDEQGNHYIMDSRGKVSSISSDGGPGPLSLTRGRASNEYVSALDIGYIEGKICILEDSRIKVFEVANTQNCSVVELNEIKDPVDAMSPAPGDMFFLFSAFSSSAKEDEKGLGNTLRLINSKGQIITESVPREDCTFSMNNISQSRDNTYYLRPQNSESIFYRLETEGVVPAFRIDFGETRMPARYFYNTAGKDIGAYMMSDYNKLPMDLHDTKGYVYCRFCGPQASECSFVYSRETKKCIAWKNKNQDSDYRVVGSDSDSFIIIPSNVDGNYGPLGKIIQPLLKEKCLDGQRAIVRVRFNF